MGDETILPINKPDLVITGKYLSYMNATYSISFAAERENRPIRTEQNYLASQDFFLATWIMFVSHMNRPLECFNSLVRTRMRKTLQVRILIMRCKLNFWVIRDLKHSNLKLLH